MTAADLLDTACPLCGPSQKSIELYPANFNADALTPEVFSARRLPDRLHYRMVRCTGCSLVRSSPIAPDGLIEELYKESTFDYEPELDNLRASYGAALEKALPPASLRGRILEVGCGNGFFLEAALQMGFDEVVGVEPSVAAVGAASPAVAGCLVSDVMRPGLFAENSFDVVCMFHVIDHLTDPLGVLRECHRVLRPGGVMFFVCHDVRALSARLLRHRSPIIDIEHTFLFDGQSAAKILATADFTAPSTGPLKNRYSLAYLLHLVPFGRRARAAVLSGPAGRLLRRLSVWVRLGNLYAVGYKDLH